MPSAVPGALLLGLGLVAAVARADPAASGTARVVGGFGVDSNPSHLLDGAGISADEMASGIADLQGSVSPVSVLDGAGEYQLGARKYVHDIGEDTLAQSADVSALWTPRSAVDLGVVASGKDRTSRIDERDYRDLTAGGKIDVWVHPTVRVTAQGDGEHFLFKPDDDYSFSGPRAALEGRWQPTRRQGLQLSLSGSLRDYHSGAVGQASGVLRRDEVGSATVGYSYRGPFAASLQYSFEDDASNSLGATVVRNRVQGDAAVRLPWRLVLAATGVLELDRFPQGLQLSPQLLLSQDDENTDQLAVKLGRPLGEGFEVQVEGATYRGSFPINGLLFHRSVAQLLVSWSI